MLENIAPYFIGFIILCIIAEAFYSSKKGLGLYDRKDTLTSIIFGVLGVVTKAGMKGSFILIWTFFYTLTPLKIETTFVSITILFFLNEFIYYWFHRLSHEIRFLWATHVNHHSSMKMNFAVSGRTPFLNAIYHILFWIPLPLIGFSPVDILAVETISFFFAFIQHTTIIPKLGVLELVLNTPSHHRVHHSCNTQYLDKNYGNTIIIYDRLFGTFAEEVEPPVYGITKNPINRGLINMIFHEWRDLLSGKYLQGKVRKILDNLQTTMYKEKSNSEIRP